MLNIYIPEGIVELIFVRQLLNSWPVYNFDRVHCPLLDYIFYLFQRENCRRESNSQVEEAGIREPLLPQMYPGLLLHILQQYKGELCISIIHALGPCRLSCPFPIPHHL